MTLPDRPPEASIVKRTMRRIVAEAIWVALAGALFGGLFWEIPFPHSHETGLILACVIWIAGVPLLEILRLMQSSSQDRGRNDPPL